MKITLLKLFYLQNFITNKNFFFLSITNKNLKTHNRGLVANIKFLNTLYIYLSDLKGIEKTEEVSKNVSKGSLIWLGRRVG